MTLARHRFLVCGVMTVAFLLVGATVYRTVIDASFLRDEGAARAERVERVTVHRGSIFDRRGVPLSVSTPVTSFWLDPQIDTLSANDIARVADAAGISRSRLVFRLETASDSKFVFVARRLLPTVATRIEALKVKGIRSMTEYRRYYPLGEVAAHVVGITDIDDSGQEGIELALDHALQGRHGLKRVLRDMDGNNIRDRGYERLPRFGQDVSLTLDARIQYLAFDEVKRAVEEHQAKSATLVMVDVEHSEILAMVNYPSYNPNQSSRRDFARMRNRAVADAYEPGSTIKPFLMLAALESGRYTPETTVDTAPGSYTVGNKLIEDPIDYGVMALPQLLAKSSQVGATKIALSLPKTAVLDVLVRAGLSDPTYLGLPGETAGVFRPEEAEHDVGRAVMSYGYGFTATPLQLIQSYLCLAAGGVRRELKLFEGAQLLPDRRVFASDTVADVVRMMEGVVSAEGTARLGEVSGLRIAGKTGTSRKVSSTGYQDDRHIALFVGMVPADAPKLLMAVVVNEPRGEFYSGGTVAAPIFARLIEKTFRLVESNAARPLSMSARDLPDGDA